MAKRTNPYDFSKRDEYNKRMATEAQKFQVYPKPSFSPGYAPMQRNYVVPRTTGGQSGGPGEMKYFDTYMQGNQIVSANTWAGTEMDPATFNCLLAPTVGSAYNQRIAREVKVHKIKISGTLSANKLATVDAVNAVNLRLILVQDQQTNASQMQGEQLMSGGAVDLLGVSTFQNIDNFGRFRVLKDKRYTLGNPNFYEGGTTYKRNGLKIQFKMSYKFTKPVSVRFNATGGGSVADIVDNSFHIIANADSDDIAVNLYYNSRVSYRE
ncbi:MAG: putative capsid protein [Cressdnaviricota sp.]|nr:MAG: putative capsid protein [Cressdnaviricota sp.]